MKKTDKKRFIITLLALVFFIYILILVFFKENNSLDLIKINRTDFLLKIFNFITNFGSWYTLIFITICFLIFSNKETFKLMCFNLIGVTLLNQFLKILFQRPRPLFNIVEASGYSFPSGHAMVSMAFYGFLIYILLKSKYRVNYKLIGSILIFVLILLIGFSRIYLGAHYITDVLAGYCLGIIYLSLFTAIIKKVVKK